MPKASNPQATSKPAAPAAMTNRDVIQLVKAKISDDVIITKIKQSKTRFDTSTHGLVALKQAGDQYFILVSIGGKVGSGHLIGANEGERIMRPFDASLTANNTKPIVPARKLEFVRGYGGVWKVASDTQSMRGPLLSDNAQELVFEARLNQNLDFKATF